MQDRMAILVVSKSSGNLWARETAPSTQTFSIEDSQSRRESRAAARSTSRSFEERTLPGHANTSRRQPLPSFKSACKTNSIVSSASQSAWTLVCVDSKRVGELKKQRFEINRSVEHEIPNDQRRPRRPPHYNQCRRSCNEQLQKMPATNSYKKCQ